ncbi:MAG: MFS transporter [Betaproteobacteria bacterium]|nr:MFS transporter [Betaproteobacteria bacterium]
MLGFATFAALLPELRDLWRLSNAEAGLIASAFFIGYVATVSYWTALTDRTDGRRVYFAGSLLATAGGVGFGLAADGLASGMFFHVLLGAGVAGTYMPGLRLLSDRTSGPSQSRTIAFYTSFFGIGIASSLALAGLLAPEYGWRSAFVASAAGPLCAGLAVFLLIGKTGTEANAKISFTFAALFPVSSWRRVIANRAAAGYTLGYVAHCIELFGSRGWMVAFLAYSAGLQAAGASFPWNFAAIAAAVNLLAVPASIFGNEIALRIGRRQWIQIAMLGSGACGIVLAVSGGLHWSIVILLLIVYSMLVMAESATLTAGLVAAAPAELRGAALGLYSLAGFTGGMLGPSLFGVALDLAGGKADAAAWVWAYAAIGAGCVAAPAVVRLFRR